MVCNHCLQFITNCYGFPQKEKQTDENYVSYIYYDIIRVAGGVSMGSEYETFISVGGRKSPCGERAFPVKY